MASHLEPAYSGHPHQPLPVTERLTNNSLVLPLHHEVTESDQERIVGVLASGLGARVAG
jgi:perosamine synthetase